MKKRLISTIFCTLLLIIVIPATGKENSNTPLPTADVDWWPMFHHDPNRTGNSTSDDAPDTDLVRWNTRVNLDMYASPAVYEDKIYAIAGNTLNRLDTSNGNIDWTFIFQDYTGSSPAVYNGKIYFGSGEFDRRVYCLNAETSAIIWTYRLNDLIWSSPAVVDGRVYLGCRNHIVYCFDAEGNGDGTTNILWSHLLGGYILSSPAVADDRVYIGSADKKVYCLSVSDGSEVWNYSTNGGIISSPMVSNGRVFIGSGDGCVYCLNVVDGEKIWKYQTGGDILWSSPAVANGRIYIGSSDGKLYCFDAEGNGDGTTTRYWSYQTDGIVTSPAVADGKVYVGSWDAHVYCIDAMNGNFIWSYLFLTDLFQLPTPVKTSPAIANGSLYVGPTNCRLYCFKNDQPPETPLQPSGPIEGNINEEYEFSTSAVDPDNDLVQYGWEWTGDDTAEDWTGLFPSGQTITQKLSWDEAGTYQLRVKAKDAYGAESAWSPPHTVTITEPELEIEVTMGVGLTTVIKNVGEGDAVDVHYSISLNEGFIIQPTSGYVEGVFDRITAGGEETVQTFVIGLGRTTIEIQAKTGSISDNETAHAFVFLFYLFQR